jgi:hypothetical protein
MRQHGEWSHLAQIQALDNTDKHRLLLAATSSTRIGGWNSRDEHGNVTTMPHHSFLQLQVDAMLRFAQKASGRTLMATWRPRLTSVAHHASLIPPTPIWVVIPIRAEAIRIPILLGSGLQVDRIEIALLDRS